MDNQMKWWETTTIYQIYPRSFKDSNGDGIGDIGGILEKLDYLESIGVETIWFSPFYKSPQKDHGYDISDFYTIEPQFGTMEQVDQLIQGIHDRGMRILMDMVMNHTSDQHPWFIESKSSLDNPKRNWYIWKSGKSKGLPPNNWVSMIGKPGWTYDAHTDQWYYSSFLDFQPDLNYDHPEVKQAMFNIVKYWLDKGVDGFRLDIFNCIGKDDLYRDNPFSVKYLPRPNNNDESFFQNKKYSINHPKSFEFAKELRRFISEYPNCFLIGEVSGNHTLLKKFIGEKMDGLHSVFLFELIHFQWNARYFKSFIQRIEMLYPKPYTPTYVYSNHDNGRGIRRVGNSSDKAKILALIQLTLRGIPIIYYGEEIGLLDHHIPANQAKDPVVKGMEWIPIHWARSLGVYLNRDNCRTPMQWESKTCGGFCEEHIQPWLPFSDQHQIINVECQLIEHNSLLKTYQLLLAIRKMSKCLQLGHLELLESEEGILLYKRVFQDSAMTIAINFTNRYKKIVLDAKENKLIFSSKTIIRDSTESNHWAIPGNCGVLFSCE